MDIHPFSRNDDCVAQAWGYGLPCCKRELGKILAQQLAQSFGRVNDLLPMDALLPRLRSWSTCLGNLVQLCSEFPTPCLPLMEIDNLGLRGIEDALGLTLKPLPPLAQLRLGPRQPCEVLVFGFSPSLMQWRDHARIGEPWTERVPNSLSEPISPHELCGARGRPANAPRRGPFARVIGVFVLFADAQWSDAPHPPVRTRRL